MDEVGGLVGGRLISLVLGGVAVGSAVLIGWRMWRRGWRRMVAVMVVGGWKWDCEPKVLSWPVSLCGRGPTERLGSLGVDRFGR